VKTAISIPDELFKSAENAAKKLNISRSELYQIAIEQYIEVFNEEDLLENLNKAYESEPSKVDNSIEAMQSETIAKATENDSW